MEKRWREGRAVESVYRIKDRIPLPVFGVMSILNCLQKVQGGLPGDSVVKNLPAM